MKQLILRSRRKFSDEQEREIRRQYFKLRRPVAEICQKFGASYTHVLRLTAGARTGATRIETICP